MLLSMEEVPVDYMTKLPGQPSRDDVRPGMAAWPGGGPKGKTCGDCQYRGYYRDRGDRSVKSNGCEMFLKLAMRHGPPVNKKWAACRHFKTTGAK